MHVKMALYGTSIDILRQAKKELAILSLEAKIDLRITLIARYSDLISDMRNYEIIAIHEDDFQKLLPEIPLFAKQAAEPSPQLTTMFCSFELPVELKYFMTLFDMLPKRDSAINIPVAKGMKVEKIDSIFYFENANRRVHVKTIFESYTTVLTMREACALTAPYPFASPYVSFLLNLGQVEKIAGRDVTLRNKDIIPLSQKKAAEFKRAYREHISKTH